MAARCSTCGSAVEVVGEGSTKHYEPVIDPNKVVALAASAEKMAEQLERIASLYPGEIDAVAPVVAEYRTLVKGK